MVSRWTERAYAPPKSKCLHICNVRRFSRRHSVVLRGTIRRRKACFDGISGALGAVDTKNNRFSRLDMSNGSVSFTGNETRRIGINTRSVLLHHQRMSLRDRNDGLLCSRATGDISIGETLEEQYWNSSSDSVLLTYIERMLPTTVQLLIAIHPPEKHTRRRSEAEL